jgi:hypothetical protein
MALVVESTSTATATVTSGSPGTITKPTGVEVGDVLVLAYSNRSSTSDADLVKPAGFTSAEFNTSSGNDANSRIMYRVADASDVSASSYTFSTATGVQGVSAFMLRVTGIDPVNSVEDSGGGTAGNATNPSVSVSIDHLVPSLLQVYMVSAQDGGGDTISAISTTPARTLTLLLDAPNIIGGYAIVDDATSITSLNSTSDGNVAENAFSFVSFRDTYPSTGTAGLLSSDPVFFSSNGSAGTNGTTGLLEVDPTINTTSGKVEQPTQWTNEDKPSTTWTNESK